MLTMTAPHLLQPVAPEISPEREWVSEQGRAHSIAADKAVSLSKAAQSGKRMQPVWRDYLRNHHVRLSAALRVLGENPSREEAMKLRDRLNPMRRGFAPIIWHAHQKENGGERYICNLPPELKAVHYMLKRPLENHFERGENIFGVKVFSRDALAKEIKDLQNQGFTGIATTDVIDCYQSVDLDAPYQLPLPKEVIRHAIDLRNHTLVRDRGTQFQNGSCNIVSPYGSAHKASGPRGLMQGSPISGIILAWLLNGIPTSDNVRVFLCFDNLIVLARKPAETRAMVDTLAAHFEQCSAGPLALCEPEYADNTPIEFLGYLFDPQRHDIGIADNALSKLETRLQSAEAVQEAMFDALVAHHRGLSSNPLMDRHDPLSNHVPAKVWEVLLSFRAGFPSVPSDALEFEVYLENSRRLAERAGRGMGAYFHDNLFAGKGTDVNKSIRQVMKAQ